MCKNFNKQTALSFLIFIVIIAIFLFVFYYSVNRESTNENTLVSDNPEFEDAEISQVFNPPVSQSPKSVLIQNVPFTSQAPLGEWDDIRQHYGCEEANLIMAMRWVNNEPLSPTQARDEIIALSEFELEYYGHFHDYSIADTYKVLKDYFKYENAFVQNNIGLEDVKKELAEGNLVLVPINGQEVKNPYYTYPGPIQHQILAIGYDDISQELIVHDPGFGEGNEFRYKYEEIKKAIKDYDTGYKEQVSDVRTAMLVIKPR